MKGEVLKILEIELRDFSVDQSNVKHENVSGVY